MSATLSTTQQAILATEVTDIVVTEVVPDGETYVREVRIMAGPEGARVPLLTVRVSGATAEAIDITTPQLSF
jgi:hypothetical protein